MLCFEGWWPQNGTSYSTTDNANGTNQPGMLLEWWDVRPDRKNWSANSDLAAPLRLSAVLSDERFPGLPIGRVLVQQQRGSVTVPLATISQHTP